MATNQPVVTSKAAIPSVSPSGPQSSPAPLGGGDVSGQRRVGGSGSFGSGASTRSSASPRNGQGHRKQSKSSKRYHRFADDDAMAETVSSPNQCSRHKGSRTNLLTGGHPLIEQPERPDFNHASYEFLVASTTSTVSSEQRPQLWQTAAPQSWLGSWLWLSRSRQSSVSTPMPLPPCQSH